MRRSVVVLVSMFLVAGLAHGALAVEDGDDGTATAPGQAFKVMFLADYVAGQGLEEAEEPADEDVEAAAASITELRAMDIGWGALFKLLKYSAITGDSVEDLIAEYGDDEGEIAFGEIKKMIRAEYAEALADHPKNFGQLNKAAKMKEKEERRAAKAAERAARKAAKNG